MSDMTLVNLLPTRSSLHPDRVTYTFLENGELASRYNQPLSNPLTCLGDGHDGIWNIYDGIGQTDRTADETIGGEMGKRQCSAGVQAPRYLPQ